MYKMKRKQQFYFILFFLIDFFSVRICSFVPLFFNSVLLLFFLISNSAYGHYCCLINFKIFSPQSIFFLSSVVYRSWQTNEYIRYFMFPTNTFFFHFISKVYILEFLFFHFDIKYIYRHRSNSNEWMALVCLCVHICIILSFSSNIKMIFVSFFSFFFVNLFLFSALKNADIQINIQHISNPIFRWWEKEMKIKKKTKCKFMWNDNVNEIKQWTIYVHWINKCWRKKENKRILKFVKTFLFFKLRTYRLVQPNRTVRCLAFLAVQSANMFVYKLLVHGFSLRLKSKVCVVAVFLIICFFFEKWMNKIWVFELHNLTFKNNNCWHSL